MEVVPVHALPECSAALHAHQAPETSLQKSPLPQSAPPEMFLLKGMPSMTPKEEMPSHQRSQLSQWLFCMWGSTDKQRGEGSVASIAYAH